MLEPKMKDWQELARYSFKMASDEHRSILSLHQRIAELEQEKQNLGDLISLKQGRKKRLSEFQLQLKGELLCPNCWGANSWREKLLLGEDGIYRGTKCDFVFASQESAPR